MLGKDLRRKLSLTRVFDCVWHRQDARADVALEEVDDGVAISGMP